MSIVYVSALQAGKECLKLIRDQIRIDCVLTIDRQQAARANVSGHADFGDLGAPVRYVHRYSMKDPRDEQVIRDLAPQLIIVNGWNRLLPPTVLALPAAGCIGFHGSWQPLPFGRGRSPISWALVNGATRFVLHVFYLDAGVDSGDIIDTAAFDITPFDTCATLHGKVGITSAALLVKNIAKILSGTAPRTPQTGLPTYLPKRTPDDGLIDWTKHMHEICNLIRASTRPYGGAFSRLEYRGGQVTMHIWEAVPFSYDMELEGRVGTIVHELDGRPLIKCRDGILLVKDFTLS